MKATRVCSVDGCARLLTTHDARGMCQTHYVRWKKTGDPGPAEIRLQKAPPLCSIEGCGKPYEARGWCQAHYVRWKKYGDPGSAEIRLLQQGDRACSVEGCGEAVGRHGSRGMCSEHAQRDRTYGDPLGSRPRYSPGFGEQHPGWLGDGVSYKSAHARVTRARGSATLRGCAHCGSQAEDWAYDHLDPDPLVGEANGSLLEYSGDIDHYISLCTPCHFAFDRAYRKGG